MICNHNTYSKNYGCSNSLLNVTNNLSGVEQCNQQDIQNYIYTEEKQPVNCSIGLESLGLVLVFSINLGNFSMPESKSINWFMEKKITISIPDWRLILLVED